MKGVVPLRWYWLVLAVLGGASTAYGVASGQMAAVAAHAARLCLDCIGLSGH